MYVYLPSASATSFISSSFAISTSNGDDLKSLSVCESYFDFVSNNSLDLADESVETRVMNLH